LKAIDLAPDREDLYASLETLIVSGEPRLPEIGAKVGEFSERMPSSPVGHYLRALVLKATTSAREEASALLKKAIALSPSFWPAHFELHHYLKDDPIRAAAALERVVALNGDFAPARYALAQVYAQIGDRERARKEREAHHRILSRQRAETERLRRSMPRLSYQFPQP
jgi:tetratricopeptide (TPR) repeat protein